ncbi:hypothetical protein [Nonomuraea sp. NPDC049684]|uniref:hypothetical protein n=1 Tax=Nonomuraea sp. NPDC049684 TaxID=3364356 RepID=UPI0037AB6E74
MPLTRTVVACHPDQGPAAPVEVEARTRQRTSQPSFNLPDVTAGVCREHLLVAEHEPLDTWPLSDQISPEPCAGTDGSCSTSASSFNERHSGSAPDAEKYGVTDDNVHNPDANCPDDTDRSDTTGLETSTRADCHCDQGLVVSDEVATRTRQRISQPSFNFPDVTAGVCREHLLQVEHEPLDTWPLSDQINPEPCAEAAGSCSTCASSFNDRDSGSTPEAEKYGVADDNVHNPDANCPDDTDRSDTTGLETSTRADCHCDQAPTAPDEVEALTRQRISQPSFNFPDVTAGVCREHLLLVEHEPLDTWPLSDQINPEPCAEAAGSCSTCASSFNDRDSGSTPEAEKYGVADDNVHNPDANCPDDTDRSDTTGSAPAATADTPCARGADVCAAIASS